MSIIQPGSVPKVVVNQSDSNSQAYDSKHLPSAYQYFENIQTFLAAIETLKLPAFEASIFERDCIQEGSSSKVVDCIVALKAYFEWQQMTGDDNGMHKPPRSPFVAHLLGRINTQSAAMKPSDSCGQLDMSANCNKQAQTACDNQKLQGSLLFIPYSDIFLQMDVAFHSYLMNDNTSNQTAETSSQASNVSGTTECSGSTKRPLPAETATPPPSNEGKCDETTPQIPLKKFKASSAPTNS